MPSAGFMFVVADGASIRGGSTVASQGREGSIEVVELNHDVHIPADVLAGAALGTRVHRPIRVTARVDKATPLMYKALTLREPCEVRIRFWRPDPAGTGMEQEYFEIYLQGAAVAGVKMLFPNSLEPETASLPESVEYNFTYQTITWEHKDGGIVHSDEWYRAPS